MPDVLCDKCKRPMKKKGILQMSGSKFEVYVCACGAEKKRAVGLL